jgi:DNA polymerase IV
MTVLYVHMHAPGADYPALLDLLGSVTPVVEALPPDAALLDVRGAVRYFGRGPEGLAELVRVRALARYGTVCTVGVGPNRLLATMAAQAGPPDAVRVVPDDPEAVAAFLRPRPAAALDGVGPATAQTLVRHGLHTIGDVADTPLATLQRLLGAAAGRRLLDRAQGVDHRPVTPNAPARAVAAEREFALDTVDQAAVRREILAMAVELGARLRVSGQVAHTLALTVRYADRSTTTRTRALPAPTGSTAELLTTAYALHDRLGLQRARLRAVTLHAEGLTPADETPTQLTLDPDTERTRRLEAVTDHAATRYAPGVVGPATLLGRKPGGTADPERPEQPEHREHPEHRTGRRGRRRGRRSLPRARLWRSLAPDASRGRLVPRAGRRRSAPETVRRNDERAPNAEKARSEPVRGGGIWGWSGGGRRGRSPGGRPVAGGAGGGSGPGVARSRCCVTYGVSPRRAPAARGGVSRSGRPRRSAPRGPAGRRSRRRRCSRRSRRR